MGSWTNKNLDYYNSMKIIKGVEERQKKFQGWLRTTIREIKQNKR